MIQILATAFLLFAQEKESPEYEYWATCKPGSWVKTRMEFDNQGKKMEYESITRLLEISPEKVVVETLRRMKTGDQTVDSPAQKTEYKAKAPQKGKIVSEKDDEITVAGKTLKCRFYEIETDGSGPQGKLTIKAWMSKEIPGGAAKSEVMSPQLKGPISITALEWEKK